MSTTVSVEYFALLREQRGLAQEVIETDATTAGELYEELQRRHQFNLPIELLRIAINDHFCERSSPLNTDDHVVFIQPVAGG